MKPANNSTYDGRQVVPIILEEEIPPTSIVIATHADLASNPLVDPFIAFCQSLMSSDVLQ